ncbi:MAG: hypothetical protein M0Z54_05290 [Thermaerobacter sp.]|nr:hypothetical protein [Thermaerobacter sp.]
MVFRRVIGAIVGLVGLVWLFQGIGVLGGSFMSGSSAWATVGLVLVLAGAWLVTGQRSRSRR